MVRNACIAAGNWGNTDGVPALARLLDDQSAIVRGHAAWALERILGDESRRLLTARLDREDDSEVREEIAAVLSA